MPICTFYLLEEAEPVHHLFRPMRALLTLDGLPTDWGHLEELLLEAAFRAWRSTGKTGPLTILLEKHERSKWPLRIRGVRFHPNRSPVAAFKVKFDPETFKIQVFAARFGWEIAHIREEYRWLVRQDPYRVPPVVPKSLKSRLAWERLQGGGGLLHSSYTPLAEPQYAPIHAQPHYAPRELHSSYAPWGLRVRRKEKQEAFEGGNF